MTGKSQCPGHGVTNTRFPKRPGTGGPQRRSLCGRGGGDWARRWGRGGGQALSRGVRGSRASREVAWSGSALEGPASRKRRKDLADEKTGGRPGGPRKTREHHATTPPCHHATTPGQARMLTEFPRPGVRHPSIQPCSDEPGTVPAAGVKTTEHRVGSLFWWSLQHSSRKRGTTESYCQSHEDNVFPELRDRRRRGPGTEPRHKGGNG